MLLDAGAGIGSLSSAFLARWHQRNFHFKSVHVDAFEIDTLLHPYLSETLVKKQCHPNYSAMIYGEDFIHFSVASLTHDLFLCKESKQYTHAILNPPYKKISSASPYRLALRNVGIETVNLYPAFVALAVAQLACGGQLVAIIPRSFCNGPYYRPFREYILKHTAIRNIHLFASRKKAFKDDGVLQENIIIRLERGGQQGPVTISTSTDDLFDDLVTHVYPFSQIVPSDNDEQFIHIPASPHCTSIECPSTIRYTLDELNICVSTGPVVDFRLKDYLCHLPKEGTVPLIYPAHLHQTETTWPIPTLKKPNAIVHNQITERWLFPSGYYCVVRRFSSKEERRRIVASVVTPMAFSGYPVLGFENHVNVFHDNKQGLHEWIARGLAIFLNATSVDEKFRCFNGHTQVNATDLRRMKYPSRNTLEQLGKWAAQQTKITQEMIDDQLEKLTL